MILRNLNDLVTWLEYGKTSGYIAAREPKEQEEHWTNMLKNLLNKNKTPYKDPTNEKESS